MSSDKINSNPIIHRTTEQSKNVYESLSPWSIEFLSNNDGSDDDYEFNQLKQSQVDVDNSIEEPIDSQEVFGELYIYYYIYIYFNTMNRITQGYK